MDLKMNKIGVGVVADTCKHHKSTGIHEQLSNDKPLKSKSAAFLQH
jgi:hypothetical protein